MPEQLRQTNQTPQTRLISESGASLKTLLNPDCAGTGERMPEQLRQTNRTPHTRRIPESGVSSETPTKSLFVQGV
jgi:hypothetical protein